MLLDHYVSAMPCWKGRVDSDSDYDAFRWHQWVQPLDLNDGGAPFDGALGFAFVGFCSDKGVARNKGRTGTALAPDFVRGQMSNLPCTFSQEVKLFDAGDIVCDEISLEEGQRELGLAVEEILRRRLFPIVLGGGHDTTFGHFQGQHNYLKDKGRTPELGIVNFDAHFDLRPYDMGNSSGTMFRQMADVCRAEGTPYQRFSCCADKIAGILRSFLLLCQKSAVIARAAVKFRKFCGYCAFFFWKWRETSSAAR